MEVARLVVARGLVRGRAVGSCEDRWFSSVTSVCVRAGLWPPFLRCGRCAQLLFQVLFRRGVIGPVGF